MMTDKRPSIARLFVGLLLLGVAAFCVTMAWSGANELRAIATKQPTPKEKTHIDLQVPGTTAAELGTGAYSIWLQGSQVPKMSDEGDLDAGDLPQIEWDISGPNQVTLSHDLQLRVNDYRLAGTFSIEQAGEYRFSAAIPDGEDFDYVYNIGDDPTAVFGEAASDIAHSLVSVFKIGVGAMLGVISLIAGLVLSVTHALRMTKPTVEPPPEL